MKTFLKSLSFNVAGHILHSLFWENLAPQRQGGGGEPSGKLLDVLQKEFTSIERFKKEFSQTALMVEGSGWVALAWDKLSTRPLILQIEKHNVNLVPSLPLLLVLDVWEHAYYLDYKNDRAKFVEAFWQIVDWGRVERRLSDIFLSATGMYDKKF